MECGGFGFGPVWSGTTLEQQGTTLEKHGTTKAIGLCLFFLWFGVGWGLVGVRFVCKELRFICKELRYILGRFGPAGFGMDWFWFGRGRLCDQHNLNL